MCAFSNGVAADFTFRGSTGTFTEQGPGKVDLGVLGRAVPAWIVGMRFLGRGMS